MYSEAQKFVIFLTSCEPQSIFCAPSIEENFSQFIFVTLHGFSPLLLEIENFIQIQSICMVFYLKTQS